MQKENYLLLDKHCRTLHMNNLRLIAAQAVDAVLTGQSLADSIDTAIANLADARDRALVQAMAYGVCRYYPRLFFILNKLLKKPLPLKERLIQTLLLVGLYQLIDMRIPPHAAVAETVNATMQLKKSWAKGLVKAV